MTLYEFESKVEKPKRKLIRGHDGFSCRCPVCASEGNDKSGTNGYVYEKDGWLHVGCQKCGNDCEVAFMSALGLTNDDRRVKPLEERAPSNRPPKPKDDNTVYRYTLANGRLVYTKTRFYIWEDDKPGKAPGYKKTFSQKTAPSKDHPKGQNLDVLGVKKEILYHLPDIKRAKEQGLTVFINEGEKAADAFKARGQVGTCTNNGGGGGEASGKWTPQHTKQLEGIKRAVIVMDLDPDDERGRNVGREYAMFVASQLWDVVPIVEIVHAKTTGSKDDAFDHFAGGFDIPDFVPRPDLLPEDDETYSFGADFQDAETEYLVEPYLPLTKCILLDANGGVGKTSLMAQWAASLSLGLHPFETENYKRVPLPCGPVKTLYLHKGEDSSEEIHTVYRANGGRDNHLIFLRDAETLRLDDEGFARIRRAILRSGARLVVMDALFYFLEGLMKSTNDADGVIPYMNRLNALARECNVTFINLRHTKKLGGAQAAKKSDPAEAGMGTQAFRNSHRGQLVIRKHPQKKHVAVVTVEKTSLMTVEGAPFAFTRAGLEVQYLPHEADALDDTPAVDQVNERSKAREVIRAVCLPGVPTLAQTLENARVDAGISIKTMERARKELGVKSMGKEKGVTDRPARNLIVLPNPATEDGLDPFADE